MRKIHFLTASLCLLTIWQSGCNKADEAGNLNGYPIDGTWIGVGNAVGYDEDYKIDQITMHITDEGILTMDDGEQDTKNLSGPIEVQNENEITITTKEKPGSIHLPAGWNQLKEQDTISYQLLKEDQLLLSYDNISYLFKKEDATKTGEISPLYTLGENNVWYSNDGSKSNENTYEFDLYNDYAELYSVSPSQTKALVTNFFYQNHEGNNFTFYTNIRKEIQLPDILSSIPEGLQYVDLNLLCDDDSLTITYHNNDLSFYNNVIYGLETNSDSYHLCDKSFRFIDGMDHYFCYFIKDEDKNTLYLYICDSEEKDAEKICGEVAINEKEHFWIWYFDKNKSGSTAKKDSNLYMKYSAMNGLKIKYSLDGSILHMETKDNKYDLMLTDYTPGKE